MKCFVCQNELDLEEQVTVPIEMGIIEGTSGLFLNPPAATGFVTLCKLHASSIPSKGSPTGRAYGMKVQVVRREFPSCFLRRIISGGQVGADIAALRAARAQGIDCGGWAPKGWRIQGGHNPELAEFGLIEAPTSDYPARTRLNVQHCDGVMRFAVDFQSPGELSTLRNCKALNRPHFDINLRSLTPSNFQSMVEMAARWVVDNKVTTLNVAGNALVQIEKCVEVFVVSLIEELRKPLYANREESDYDS